jgi:succinate-semialdehyde dehydrogenase/glutarate-semialdehyde dehydrogenase
MDTLILGDGMTPSTTVGPLISGEAHTKVSRLVDAAKNAGATVERASCTIPAGSNFYPPTIVTKVSAEMPIWKEEIFGPVCTIATFTSDDEAIDLANKTPYGLAAYVYSANLSRAISISERLEYGMVGVNDTGISAVQAPFGGVKESGFGREGSSYGIDEYLVLKYLSVQM